MPHFVKDSFWEATDKLPFIAPPFKDTKADENHHYIMHLVPNLKERVTGLPSVN